jgi:hypothetical protein
MPVAIWVMMSMATSNEKGGACGSNLTRSLMGDANFHPLVPLVSCFVGHYDCPCLYL